MYIYEQLAAMPVSVLTALCHTRASDLSRTRAKLEELEKMEEEQARLLAEAQAALFTKMEA